MKAYSVLFHSFLIYGIIFWAIHEFEEKNLSAKQSLLPPIFGKQLNKSKLMCSNGS